MMALNRSRPGLHSQARNGVTVGARLALIVQTLLARPSPINRTRRSGESIYQLARDWDVCGDEGAAVGRALDPELPVQDGKPVRCATSRLR
jgi:hypothetical protein